MKVNRNNLAKELTEQEGLRESVSIAQMKEILKLVFGYDLEYVVKIWQAYND